MNENQRLQLQKIITENNVDDNTELIRRLKHSERLKDEVNQLLKLKKEIISSNPQDLHIIAMSECSFLYTNYPDIYNKIRKDEINLTILFEAFEVLSKIENGNIDQHEGAFEFGNLLKQVYIDSALKKAEKLNQEEETNQRKAAQTTLTWQQYKQLNKKQFKDNKN
jgi:hypothetical protein